MYTPTTHEVAAYMKKRFIAELKGSAGEVQLPRFPLDLLEECNFAIKLLVKATRNQSE